MKTENRHMITLKTKLTPPRIANTIRRTRLEPVFDALEKNRLIAVTAGAGHGKSTAAAQACRRLGYQTVWYRLEPSDRDLPVLVHYLVAGLRQHYDAFGSVILGRIRSAGEQKVDSRSILTLLVHELDEKALEHIVIVLDDFHLVQESREVCESMEFLLDHLPEQIHWILTGRTDLKIDLSRRIAARQALTVTAKELAFTRSEIRRLYEKIFSQPLVAKDLEKLEAKTGGWAAGLVLCHYAVKSLEPDGAAPGLDQLRGDHQLFYDYLEKNVFRHMSVEVKNFLMQTAILPTLEVDFCNGLLEIDNAGEILGRLVKKHLFTFALDETGSAYHYHHLFRDFLSAALQETFEPQAVEELFHRAGRLWADRGVHHEAVGCYLKAGAYEAACHVLVENGHDMAVGGRGGQVLCFCGQIPGPILDQEPRLRHLMGTCLNFQGRSQEALETFQRARRLFENRKDRHGVDMCLVNIAGIHALQRDVIKAKKIHLQVVAQAGHLSEPYLSSLSNLIYLCGRTGEIAEADAYYRQAGALMDEVGDTLWPAIFHIYYAFRFIPSGDYDQTIYYAEKAARIAERFKAYYWIILSCHLISNASNYQGRHHQAYQAALKGIRLSEKYGFIESCYAWCLLNAGMAKAGMGQFAEALDYCRKSLPICIQTESDWSEAWCWINISYIEARMGNLEGAEAAGRRAFTAIERTTFEPDRNFMRVALAYGLTLNGRFAEAGLLIAAIKEIPPYSKGLICWAKMVEACCNWYTGRMEAAKAGLSAILQQVRDENSAGVLQVLADFQAPILPVLRQIYLEGDYQGEIAGLIPHLKERTRQGLQFYCRSEDHQIREAAKFLLTVDAGKKAADLRIRCFGAFELVKGDTQIFSKAWVNHKARTLFKYLAFHSADGYIPRERLLELLWPEQDPAKTSNRLRVALSAIRKLLQPELLRGEASAYLLRKEDAYRLHLGSNGYLDVTAFDRRLKEAESAADPQQAFTFFLKAESLYRGELFADEPYTQWCVDLRETYKEKYVALLSRIVDLLDAAGKVLKSINYLERALAVDPYAEILYCRLMDLYMRSGNRFMAVKTYERCKRKIEIDLQCPISSATDNLYRHLLSNGRI